MISIKEDKMKIERDLLVRCTIEQFAEEHDLIMEVHERHPNSDPTRFYARFKDAELSDGIVLSGVYGDGATEEEAIRAYARRISRGFLVIGAFTEGRRDIRVPVLID